jgi:hypothetical protein
MELGLLVTGGKLPGQVQEHFERLVDTKVLLPVGMVKNSDSFVS